MEIASAPVRVKRLPSWLLNQSALVAQRLVTNGLTGAGARRSHYAVLAALEERGPASQATLGRRCSIDRSDMVALLDEMADGKLVERSPDAADRRRNVVTITAAGRRQLRKLDGVLDAVQQEILAPLSPVEREELVRVLTRVVEHHAHPTPQS